jgi:hypothetical protein
MIKRMVNRSNAFAGLLACLCFSAVFAHQQKSTFIEVLYNQRSGNMEISQRFDLHDAEHAVQQLFDSRADILNSRDTQVSFYEYAAQNFSIERPDGSSINLENLGFEIEGKFFWVYQQAPLAPELSSLRLSSTVLQDLWADQLNWVNIERDGEIKTAVFGPQNNQIEIFFD